MTTIHQNSTTTTPPNLTALTEDCRSTDNLVRLVTTAVFLPLGTVGNLASIVLVHQNHRKYGFSIFLISLAFSDLLVLYLCTLPDIIGRCLLGVHFMHTSLHWCRGWWFVLILTTNLSAWYLCLISVERSVAAFLPFYAKRFSSAKNAFKALALVTLLLIAIDSWNVIGRTSFDDGRCSVGSGVYLSWLNWCVYSIVPGSIMLVSSVAILLKYHYSDTKSNSSKQIKANVRIAIGLNVLFLVCTTPILALFSIDNFFARINQGDQSAKIVEALAQSMIYLNSAGNFYLYLATSGTFRHAARKLFRPPSRNLVEPSKGREDNSSTTNV